MTSRSEPDRNGATGTNELFIVRVKDEIVAALAGHDGASYQSPPHRHDAALALVRLLLGRPEEVGNGAAEWTSAIAGGRRTVTLERIAFAPDRRPLEP